VQDISHHGDPFSMHSAAVAAAQQQAPKGPWMQLAAAVSRGQAAALTAAGLGLSGPAPLHQVSTALLAALPAAACGGTVGAAAGGSGGLTPAMSTAAADCPGPGTATGTIPLDVASQQQHQGDMDMADALMFTGQDATAAAAAACSDVLAAAVDAVTHSPAVELQHVPLIQTHGLQASLMQQQLATTVSGGQEAAALQPMQQQLQALTTAGLSGPALVSQVSAAPMAALPAAAGGGTVGAEQPNAFRL